MKAINIEGQVFGKLTALKVVSTGTKRQWLCKCECGGEITTDTFQLTSGNITQCKNPWHKSTIRKNDRFGKLVITDISRDVKNRRTMFDCVCDCGNTKTVSARNLQRGATTHCGCDRDYSNYGLPEGESLFNALFTNYKQNAKHKNLTFTLTKEETKNLFESNCYFCGTAPEKEFTKKNLKGSFTYNGIDRIDSSKGYTKNNVNPCCESCNFLKGNRSNEEFLSLVKKIASNH